MHSWFFLLRANLPKTVTLFSFTNTQLLKVRFFEIYLSVITTPFSTQNTEVKMHVRRSLLFLWMDLEVKEVKSVKQSYKNIICTQTTRIFNTLHPGSYTYIRHNVWCANFQIGCLSFLVLEYGDVKVKAKTFF